MVRPPPRLLGSFVRKSLLPQALCYRQNIDLLQMPSDQVSRNRKSRAKRREIKHGKSKPKPRREPVKPDAARRARLEKSPADWLKFYLSEAYPLPFGQGHIEIIDNALYAARTGNNYAVGASRGMGKSTVLWGIALYLLLTQQIRFPAYIPWAAKDQRKALRFWKNALCHNDRLLADYEDVCLPFSLSKGSAQKLLTLTIEGDPTGAQLRLSDGMIVLPYSRGVIGSSTVNGNPRGLNHATESGEVLRPDLILIDDPQDKETARSAAQVANTIDVIDSDIAGMAGPDASLPMLMACTVLVADDVADHYLSGKAPDWKATRIPQITSWPENMALWEKWNEARLAGEDNRDGGKAGRDFYEQHKAELTKGFAVSWEHRYSKKNGHPDAYYAAMLDYFKMGRAAFMAERQVEPEQQGTQVYELTPSHVMGKASGLPPFHVPDTARIVVAFTDINRSGLHWCVAAFTQDMTPHVCAYGRWPQRGDLWEENATEQTRKAAIFKGLCDLGRQLAEMPLVRLGQRVRVGLFLVDRGYEPDVVHRFAAHAKLGFRVMASRGYGGAKYQVRKASLVGAPLEGCHVTETQFGQYIAHNADYWREISQRSWLGELGEPGTATLFGADPRAHTRFAEHCTAEVLLNKYKTDQGMRWEWRLKVGTHNDLGDAYTGCFVAAAISGLSSAGQPFRPAKRRIRETRKPRIDPS